MSFAAGGYTSREASCGQYPLLLRGKSVEVPIYANFNDKVLGFSETTKIQGDVMVEYRILDAQRKASKAISLVFNNRNAATWADDRVVGAFISPQDPVMLEISKYVAGLVRVRSRPEIDKFLQYGMGMFEGLRVYGVAWTADPNMPYIGGSRRPNQAGLHPVSLPDPLLQVRGLRRGRHYRGRGLGIGRRTCGDSRPAGGCPRRLSSRHGRGAGAALPSPTSIISSSIPGRYGCLSAPR